MPRMRWTCVAARDGRGLRKASQIVPPIAAPTRIRQNIAL